MTNPINGFGPPQFPAMDFTRGAAANGAAKDSVNFQDLLLNSISRTNEQQLSADRAVEESLAGGDVTQVEVATEMKKADLSMRMMLQIRNKLLEAYNEIKEMRM